MWAAIGTVLLFYMLPLAVYMAGFDAMKFVGCSLRNWVNHHADYESSVCVDWRYWRKCFCITGCRRSLRSVSDCECDLASGCFSPDVSKCLFLIFKVVFKFANFL
ncbi:DUF5391 family protein [Bacillus licheniformis]|uniref:DUF5391 family protein n=1 Tax=Bacillus licheniformis TaxID=1402 RepID=UPI001EF6BC4D|nr:DUF5391 family protein [Bacillus licheniformis]